MPLAGSTLLFSSCPCQLPVHHFNFFLKFSLEYRHSLHVGYQNYILTSLWWKFHKAKIQATWDCSIYACAIQKEMEKDNFEEKQFYMK